MESAYYYVLLGALQGITEWLPVSSEGVIVLVQTAVFKTGAIGESIELALFLHAGTFLAAFFYFRKEIGRLLVALFHSNLARESEKKALQFIIGSTLISGLVGAAILYGLSEVFERTSAFDFFGFSAAKVVIVAIGVLLLNTAYLQLKARDSGMRIMRTIGIKDWLLLGAVQGCAVLPGLSRSGLTVSALLLRKVNKEDSLKLSFLMSLPIVLAGTIALNVRASVFHAARPELWLGVGASFVVGYATIGILMRIAKRVNFGYFVLLFAILTFISALL